MKDFRIEATTGKRIDFTCENSKFRTNLNKGSYPGKVFPSPLCVNGTSSLWLEHVVGIHTGEEFFWLMWYANNGKAALTPASGVANKDDLAKIINGLVTVSDDLL